MKKIIFCSVLFVLAFGIWAQENTVMYANAPAGLRVRSQPSVSGERIGVLEYLAAVRIIREDGNIITIDGIEGKWTFIETDNIQGWVFGGYLAEAFSSMEDVISYFSSYHNLYSSNAENRTPEEQLAYLNIRNYSIASSRSYDDVWGGVTEEYNINFGLNSITLRGNPDIPKFLVDELVITIDQNTLRLFPYRNISEFRASETFFQVNNSWTNVNFGRSNISYTTDFDSWTLEFDEGIISRVIYRNSYR